ncbi:MULTISPECIES: TRAP transporter small permease [unclassified Clostridium]|jgi:TRAP-type C4-dicarboxylate transport system permease small subunit|uniref:TRAP transporter small permease n=1 Tax=unclassified Clostridium TaxID=2614128 RepID=UPI001105A459|nr:MULTISPECIES: TRAP transporter small permease [unclassified Clostridium]
MKRTLRWLDVNFEAILMVVFFSLMILLVTLQVVLRFVFKTGFSWGEEVARLLFVWMAFSSFGYLTRGSRHVRVGFFRELFPEQVQKAILIVCDALFLVFSAGGLAAMVQLCSDAWRFRDMLTAVPWNYNALYLAGLLGFFMMAVRNVQILVWKFSHWGDELGRFVNYDGDYYRNNRICFEPKVKNPLELAEKEAEELLEKGE